MRLPYFHSVPMERIDWQTELMMRYFSNTLCRMPLTRSYFAFQRNLSEIQRLRLPPTERIGLTKNRHIPISRHELMRHIQSDKSLLTTLQDKLNFESLCKGLDSALVTNYIDVLHRLERFAEKRAVRAVSADLLPDVNECRALDNEYWLIQHLLLVMERAGFRELSRRELEQVIREKATPGGVNIFSHSDDYETLKMWVQGRTMPAWYKWRFLLFRIWNHLFPRWSISRHTYERVAIAVRSKDQDGRRVLSLKVFQHVPSQSLQHLLPIQHTSLSFYDKLVFKNLATLIIVGIYVKLLSMCPVPICDEWIPSGHWKILILGSLGLTLHRYWVHSSRSSFTQKQSTHLQYSHLVSSEVPQTLNLLLDLAQEEDFKRSLVVYSCLLIASGKKSNITERELDILVNKWIEKTMPCDLSTARGDFQVPTRTALDILQCLGLVLACPPNKQCSIISYKALPLHLALARLPVWNRSPVALERLPSRDVFGTLKTPSAYEY